MSDLTKAEYVALIHRLEDQIISQGDEMMRDTAYISELSLRINRLTAELAAARERERWIPVGERLPDPAQRDLVDILRKCPDGYDYQIGSYILRNGRLKWWSEILACELAYVIAWRELPAAPAQEVKK